MGIKLYLKVFFSLRSIWGRNTFENTKYNDNIILILVLSMATFHLVYGRYIVPSDMLKGVSYYKKENFFLFYIQRSVWLDLRIVWYPVSESLLMSSQSPNPHRSVPRARGDREPSWSDGDLRDSVVVTSEVTQVGSGDVPHVDSGVITGGQQ